MRAVKMKVMLNNKLYSREAIEVALKDFEEICSGKILNGEIVVELESKEEIENIGEEFCNYVLGLMKNNMLA